MNALLIVGLVLAAPGVKDPPKKAEVPAIVGEWQCDKLIFEGEDWPFVQGIRLEVMTDGKYRWWFGPEPREGTCVTNATKTPGELSMVSAATGKAKAGIYKLDKDTLVICLGDGPHDRPTKFESPAGKRIVLMSYRRVEPKKD
jgi:uncharacterized protein (TIGR03067 family)